jgi:hypothetical protein
MCFLGNQYDYFLHLQSGLLSFLYNSLHNFTSSHASLLLSITHINDSLQNHSFAWHLYTVTCAVPELNVSYNLGHLHQVITMIAILYYHH